MEKVHQVPTNITAAAVAMLTPYIPGITADELENALSRIRHGEDRPKAYTRKEAARIIGVSMRTIDEYAAAGILERFKIGAGKLVRLTAESVLKAAGQL